MILNQWCKSGFCMGGSPGRIAILLVRIAKILRCRISQKCTIEVLFVRKAYLSYILTRTGES
jgi:hypothetical protein